MHLDVVFACYLYSLRIQSNHKTPIFQGACFFVFFRTVGVSWFLCFFAVLVCSSIVFFFVGEKKRKMARGLFMAVLSYLILSYFLLSDAANIINIISYLMAPSYNPRDNKKKTEKERQLGKHY